eukprot:m.127559 g.127559  ORF g.127559 m.127559 type:complete len:470 (+) comp11212_c0_seq1:270-1679(+)
MGNCATRPASANIVDPSGRPIGPRKGPDQMCAPSVVSLRSASSPDNTGRRASHVPHRRVSRDKRSRSLKQQETAKTLGKINLGSQGNADFNVWQQALADGSWNCNDGGTGVDPVVQERESKAAWSPPSGESDAASPRLKVFPQLRQRSSLESVEHLTNVLFKPFAGATALMNKYRIPPLSEDRWERLKTLDLLLIDNSLRESTVVQVYGHVEADKDIILDSLKNVGAQYVVAGAFGDLERVDDKWLAGKKAKDLIEPNWITFSEIVEWTDVQESEAEDLYQMGLMEYEGGRIEPPDELPRGLAKSSQYGLYNVIFEMDTNCPMWNSVQATCQTHQVMLDHIDRVIGEARNMLMGGQESGIFINLRDMFFAWSDQSGYRARARMLTVVQHLAQMPPEKRIKGIMFEEMTGEVSEPLVQAHGCACVCCICQACSVALGTLNRHACFLTVGSGETCSCFPMRLQTPYGQSEK